jgi:2,3-bisphosphoglycerate-independent phosphoglycerate mutase
MVYGPPGELGLATPSPKDGTGSDVANLSIMGYDQAIYHTGHRQAASLGKPGAPGRSLPCNLVTLRHKPVEYVADYSAGHIPSRSRELILSISRP